MQPYLAQGQRMAGGRRWSRSRDLGAIVAVSLIPRVERSGLQTHIAATESGSLCVQVKSLWNSNRRVVSQSAALDIVQNYSRLLLLLVQENLHASEFLLSRMWEISLQGRMNL